MKNEDTILDEQFVQNHSSQQAPNKATQSTVPQQKKSNTAEKLAYGAAGAVVGAGATLAGQAVAANATDKPEIEPEKENATTDVKTEAENSFNAENTAAPKPEDSPNPEEAIIVTDDGVRVAQVSDNLSFSQAFAEARSQVGPGGVFEWHGKVYGTYYKDEWEAMTPQERAEYQASIDYDDIANSHEAHNHSETVVHDHQTVHHVHHVHHEHTTVEHGNAQQTSENLSPNNMEQTIDSQEDVEVSIIDAGTTDLNGDGEPEYSVLLDCNGQEVLIVDIDTDGYAEIAISDLNDNGQIDEGEIEDISGAQMQMPEMEQEQQDPYMTASNDMPDYMNDADAGAYMA